MEQQNEQVFNDIKKMIFKKTILNCPYCNLNFTIHPDASDKQLYAVISQNNRPIVFLTIKNTNEV